MAGGNAVLAGPMDRDRVVLFIPILEQAFDLVASASLNDRPIEVHRSLSSELWPVLALILISGNCVAMLSRGLRAY